LLNLLQQMNTTTIKTLLTCGIIAPTLFVITFIVEDATRLDGYNPMKHPVSSLAIGDLGWIQTINFLITGLLTVAFATGLRRILKPPRGSILIGLVGMGLIGAGFCTSDPVYGYPINLPLVIAQFTVRGHLHDFFSIFVFVCLPIACFKFRKWFMMRQENGLAIYSVISAILMLLFFILAGAAFKQTPGLLEFAGLFQRLSIVSGVLWILVLAVYLRRNEKFLLVE